MNDDEKELPEHGKQLLAVVAQAKKLNQLRADAVFRELMREPYYNESGIEEDDDLTWEEYLSRLGEWMYEMDRAIKENLDFQSIWQFVALIAEPATQDAFRQAQQAHAEMASKRAKANAEEGHNKPGGTREKHAKIRALWATGKYATRALCTTEEFEGLGFATWDTARKALRNTPDPNPWPGKRALQAK